MKRFLTSVAAFGLMAGAAAADYKLTILHTNDFHDRFDPISKYDGPCSAEDNTEGKCFGGIARMITAIGDARARGGENQILLDAGDQFQGSLFYTQYGGVMAAEFMEQLNYDAMAVGNHEFDDGPEGFAPFLDLVSFPVISANIDVSGNNMLAGKIDKSTILEVGGERIGIVSVLAEDTAETSSPGASVIFSSAIDAAQAEVDALTGQGINKIILLTHVGLPKDMELAEALTDVDLIIGGHSHTLLSNTNDRAAGPYPTLVNDVPIVQAYAYGKYLGELNVTFDDAGNLSEIAGEPILLDASVVEDKAVVARVKELAIPLEELRNKVVAQTDEAIGGDRSVCRAMECTMGNLIADAMLARVKDQGIDVALQNGGGIRASIEAGEVTMGEVLTVLPFQNTLSTFEVTGAVLLEALENGVSQVEEGAGRFPQVSGMTYAFDGKLEAGSRISDVMINGAPLDPAKTYGVVSNNYVRNGGDGYKMFKSAANAYDFGPDLADVTAEYIAANAPYKPYTDGRITVK
ncbi:multifunctional 2',3'-cyclic-nucleotide 2'-phosphodiesterase/5'-nucleotidase/3'-nucleotidase [Sulfitobacter sp. M57]|uniref:bifunctional metallophosphatase/5'-nucleotidase n=1 Tax=unclassified Sulfitobacter TaxID=196795 RepID=UPI0023E2A6A8|nr:MULTISPECIES: bifunctional metallophosphatase/5'-nucleotidase [unclassified Sulfitobacter]MDF3415686.1 multifunctional 2',3'-cyclic-nucleotide 2'-phosphodiesterase/5'-nucleotidase/3'-nucleotidase [Sulfitobacter sp. KE5]MDF3423166.1 multifunctional 2',3'-cyclic-nucleotide 2'-phosphodiesterase/5'-nucleotidase/3'-nucleotidase [Sulfitobacter sp. KE43]MDF3434232.1 multifunctional 2',3'-cyclic-nucleotide 2'-phosphodiesterase/5'-nucleotidase/3'-nucleotidase [Sulfitobacter sp. KE42]MDF3459735.1 mult